MEPFMKLSLLPIQIRAVSVLAAGVLLLGAGCRRQPEILPPTVNPPAPPVQTVPEPIGFPTDQTNLLSANGVGVFQPTEAGTVESALFGSVRTAQRGNKLVASFHEGIDIAPLRRDSRGRPLDTVYAAAAGNVAYINRVGGNSNYGRYVVLAHPRSVGTVYTLYAHLANIASGLGIGRQIQAGETVGTVGNSSSSGIPMSRAHLHFEVALLLNVRFDGWFHAQKLKPDHGLFNGRNLVGVDPLAVFAAQSVQPDFTFAAFVSRRPRAFDVIATGRLPDFFRRYPSLWEGAIPTEKSVMVISCTENGLPVKGRIATAEEAVRAKGGIPVVVNVDEAVLGRNGSHLILRRQDEWQLGQNGGRWLAILLY